MRRRAATTRAVNLFEGRPARIAGLPYFAGVDAKLWLAPLYRLSGLVGAGSLAGRFGKLGCPGDGGPANGLSFGPVALNSLALTPSMLGFLTVSARTAPSAGSSLWIRFRARSMADGAAVAVAAGLVAVVVAGFTVVVAGLTAVVVAGFTAAVVAGLMDVVAGLAAVVVAGLTLVVVAGLIATDVDAGLATVVVAGARTAGACAGAARTTGAERTTGAGAARTTGAGAARTTGAGAGAELVVFLVSA